jgi:hypothetical protein
MRYFAIVTTFFTLRASPPSLTTKPKSLAGKANWFAVPAKRFARNGIKLARKVIFYGREAFCIACQLTKPCGNAFWFESERTTLARIAQCD